MIQLLLLLGVVNGVHAIPAVWRSFLREAKAISFSESFMNQLEFLPLAWTCMISPFALPWTVF